MVMFSMLLLAATVVQGMAQHEGEIRKAGILSGKALFDSNCATCHGADGKGDTPLAMLLIKGPASLTAIAKENDGVFPFLHLLDVIDGRNDFVVHGPKGMPVWGNIFHNAEYPHQASGLVFDLTLYLESIQEN